MKQTIKFIRDCEIYPVGLVVELDANIADVFVNWRRVAINVEPEAKEVPARQISNKQLNRSDVLKKAVGAV